MSVPGHALREKGLQRQIGVSGLLGSQERRAAVVLQINRWSTAGFVPPSVYIRFRLFALPKNRSGQLSSMFRVVRGTVVSWANRPVGVPSCPALFAPSPRRALPFLTPPVVCPSFGFDKFQWKRIRKVVTLGDGPLKPLTYSSNPVCSCYSAQECQAQRQLAHWLVSFLDRTSVSTTDQS